MSSQTIFTHTMLVQKSYTEPWNGCIILPKKNTSNTYELHATGDADLNGRKYVSLPTGTKLTDKIKREFNIL